MPTDKDDRAYLWDMLTAAKAVSDFVRGRSIEEYLTNLMLRSAVERQVEIIGEAARRVMLNGVLQSASVTGSTAPVC